MLKRTLLLMFSLWAMAGAAQPPQTYNCQQTPQHRQFDFWVGEWVVTDKPGEKIYGQNTISRHAGGCLLLEEYSSGSGLTGSSLNYYDPSSKKWHQHWVDSGSSIIRLSGGMLDESMMLEGTIYYLVSGKTATLRGVWTPLADGRVRQFFEQQTEAGEWATWFDGYYRRTSGSATGGLP